MEVRQETVQSSSLPWTGRRSRLANGSWCRRPSKGAGGRLEQFVGELRPEMIHAAAQRPDSLELRVGTAIALLVVGQAGAFARELRSNLQSLPPVGGRTILSASQYDAAAFEAAAFSFHCLLKPFRGRNTLAGDEDEDGDALDEDEGQFFNILKIATLLGGAVLQEQTTFSLGKKFFFNRAWYYGLRPRTFLPDEFASVLIGAIAAETPNARRGGAPALELNLTFGTNIAATMYFTHMIPAIMRSARAAFDNADELGLLPCRAEGTPGGTLLQLRVGRDGGWWHHRHERPRIRRCCHHPIRLHVPTGESSEEVPLPIHVETRAIPMNADSAGHTRQLGIHRNGRVSDMC